MISTNQAGDSLRTHTAPILHDMMRNLCAHLYTHGGTMRVYQRSMLFKRATPFDDMNERDALSRVAKAAFELAEAKGYVEQINEGYRAHREWGLTDKGVTLALTHPVALAVEAQTPAGE